MLTKATNPLVKIALENKSIIRAYANIIDTIEIERWTMGSYEKLEASIRTNYLEASSKLETFSIDINGQKREIQEIHIGKKAKNLKRNLIALIDANERYITNPEIEKLIIELVEKYIK